MKRLLFVIILTCVSGCSSILNTGAVQLRDNDMVVGCYVTEGTLGFDSYFKTTKVVVDMCKLKCSKKLPLDFYYEYENPRTGCKVGVNTNGK